MRVFLTGASGFIGSHVLRALLTAGHEVTALVVPGDSCWRLGDLLGRFSAVTGTLADLRSVRAGLENRRPEACLHLAWYMEPGKCMHAPENVHNLTATLEFVRELGRHGCSILVGSGTCAEYDSDLGYLREDGPTRPTTLYAASKAACYLVGQPLAAAADMRFAWARIFNCYGPYEDERRVVPALIRALLRGESFLATDGEQVRDYVHVEDVASALVMLAEHAGNGIFNIASGVPVTIRQLMETVGELLECSHLIQFGALPYREWDPRFMCGDNQRLRGLGWVPRYGLRHGLQQTIDWWRGEGRGSHGSESVRQ